MNYGNDFSDVITMAHELGHGFHGHCLNSQTAMNANYPMPIAETASTFCETIVKKAALKNASQAEQLMILENELSD
ncbi:MAG: M3 family metallopeptidase [Coprobacillus cateniformis]